MVFLIQILRSESLNDNLEVHRVLFPREMPSGRNFCEDHWTLKVLLLKQELL